MEPRGRFPARQRVRKRPEFQRIQQTGRRVNTSHFILLLYARDSAEPRLGVTVSRKVGPAVVRNRAKRLIREAFRATRDWLDTDIDLVVIVRRPLGELGLGAVIEEWSKARRSLQRAMKEARSDREKRAQTLAEQT